MKDRKDLSNLSSLDADELELFHYLLEEENIDDDDAQAIKPRASGDVLPLSFAQQRLWFLNQLEPESTAYNMAGAIHLEGRLDGAALEQSLNEIIRRHEVLRTTFKTINGEPVQVVAPSLQLLLPVVNVDAPDDNARADITERLKKAEAAQPFDLRVGPLVRAQLLRLGDEHHVLLLSMHHIVSDGWSIGVLTRELAALYEWAREGKEGELAELGVQYGDYAMWQRGWLEGEVLERELDYWKAQLGGDLPVLQLPTDRPRQAVRKSRGATHTMRIPESVCCKLKSLSRSADATLFMTLLAAFDVVLQRYTAQEDIIVGTPVANRNRPEIEDLIGFFVNTLVLRADLSGNPSFQELLSRVRKVALEAFAHQDVPFEKLVETLQPERDRSRAPLFQVMLSWQSEPLPSFALEGLRMSVEDTSDGAAKFDLTLELTETMNGLDGVWQYNAELFEARTIERLAGHFQTLLEGIAANPGARISELPLLTFDETRQLLIEWNGTDRNFPAHACLHQQFEAQARRTPDAVAVFFEDEQLTYAELNAQANRLAHYLMSHGVAPEVRVGLLMERSLSMIVGLLGVMKAGGAYVPLDPAYPRERLGYMMNDARIEVLLTQQRWLEKMLEDGARVVCLDECAELTAGESDANPSSGVVADNMIYLIYTSGSTGKPKGVMVHHRGVVNCLDWLQRALQLDATDRLMLKASLSFDASVWELFGALLVGGAVVVARPGGQQDAAYLAQTIRRYGVTGMHFVPSMLQVFLDESELDETVSLKHVLCGGEALAVETLERFGERLTARLHDFYGPTEGSIGSIDWLCEFESGRRVVPIGTPINNTRAYILDPHGHPVPAGIDGELYLGGVCVARGYLDRRALTAERFVPDPFSAEAGARLYRTGDVARWNSAGEIEFLGRVDQQVKLRGFRIELGEIEAVLGAHPSVRETLVAAREDTHGDKRLIAYVVSTPDTSDTTKTLDTGDTPAAMLRRFVREQLPDYMLPSQFILLDSLPLTQSGKVDRKALPEPCMEHLDVGARVRERGRWTVVEEMMVGMWEEVLGVSGVGVGDNFFEMGGHSLMATQLVSRLRLAFDIDLPLSRFFDAPVISELARVVETQMQSERGLTVPSIHPVARDKDLPLSFAQQRLWFLDQLEPGNPIYNTPGAVRLSGRLDAEALARSLDEIVRRHESLRTAFRVNEGTAVQVVVPPQGFAVEVVELDGLAGGEREEAFKSLSIDEARKPFDLTQSPLLRATLLRFAVDEHVLLVTMHHIISDGWSVGVLVRELSALYNAFAQGQPSPLKEPALQYADYAVWQRQWLTGEVLDGQLDYWRGQLAGLPPVLELPADRPRPKMQSFHGAQVSFELPESLTKQLKTLSQREGATLFMTLLAALQSLLLRYTGEDDIAIGVPVANRRHREIEDLIGFFVNTLVLRTDLSGDPSFRELLRRVRKVSLEAYAHQDLPFEMLVEELQPERDLSHTPLFQTLFVLQNAPAQDLELSGLSLSLLDTSSETAKFDLTLSVEETPRGLSGILEYSTDLFDETTIRRMLRHFETLLAGIVRQPDARLSALPLLDTGEEHQLLDAWNQTATDFPDNQPVHQLFTRRAGQTPDETALVFGEERLSYAELNRRANQLGRYLCSLGVGAESVVGIMLERSLEMMVSVVGILKAGGAYMPLDPQHPPERLAFMLEDSGTTVLITDSRLNMKLNMNLPQHEMRVVCLDTDWDIIAEESEENTASNTSGDNLAYVIYTSGSSGRPKAVAMPHRALSNLVNFQLQSSTTSQPPRTLQFASLSFDVSVQEMFSTWCAGATLVLISEDARRDGGELARVLVEQQVERLFLPFVALQHLAENVEVEGIVPSHLREVITAGEQLKITRHIRQLFDGLDDCILDNHYGPTETHLASVWRLRGAASEWPKLPPIGQPIANAQIYVLDDKLRPVPVGVTGELYIGGDGLARGYLRRPAQTAASFVPHPFSRKGGERLYRTGDLARHLADGRLEYVGRSDNQVKVRGFRIEVGEVESVLKQHGHVKQAAVTAWEDEAGRKRLVAYVVSTPDTSDTTKTLDTGDTPAAMLRRFVREQLPDYMLPSQFILLDSLPLTQSGKVDRKALPEPCMEHLDVGARVRERGRWTVVEEMMVGMWEEVLGVSGVGVGDNFFEMGGHSLMATQLVSRLRLAFQVELPLRRLFEHPTLSELAQCIETEIRVGHQSPSPPVRAVARDKDLPLSFAQQRLWFLDKLEPGSPFYNLSAAIRIDGHLDETALEQSLDKITARHEILRTTFATVAGQPVQVVNPHTKFALLKTNLSHLTETEREATARRLAHEEAAQPFDLRVGPLVRAQLLRLGDEHHVLLLSMHHIVSDGWSIGVLTRELAALYEWAREGKEGELAELGVQYGDYAMWQRGWLEGEVLERELDYWKAQLAGAPPALELPTDQPRPPIQTYRGAQHSFVVPLELAEALKALSRREGATLYMTLLAAFQTLLHRYTGQEDILTGTPIAGRNRRETEDLIGFFVNTLVLRGDVAGNPTFRELLRRTRETTLGAYAHQDVPFEKLVEELQPERRLSHTPLFQVLFALQNAPQSELTLPGVDLQLLDVEVEMVRFDLTLNAAETGEGLVCQLAYNTDLFEAATAQRMAGHYVNLLRAIAAGPEQRVAGLSLMLEDEINQVLVEWNNTRVGSPPELCIQEIFEMQAGQTPDAVAVRFMEEMLTYRQLDERSNQLAHYLKGMGVGVEMRVAICMERSCEMVVGLMGVLKAGAAYVPMSPDHPLERIAFMLKDAGVSVLLTQQGLLEDLPDCVSQVVRLDGDREIISRQNRATPPLAATPDNLAYIIYTSGSTGTPKGVQVRHRGLMHSTHARLAYYTEPVGCFLLVSPFFFDSSAAGIFWTLSQGGTLVLTMENQTRDLTSLVGSMARSGVTHLLCLPSLYALLLTHATTVQLASLRSVIVAGEPCPRELVARHYETLPEVTLFNEYGPTEATVWSSVKKCLPHEGEAQVSIGRAIPNTQIYLLDKNWQPVPVGVAGELCIGGDGLARGYMQQPKLTAEKFIPHPFGVEPGARLYKTGDLARRRADGDIEFLGRIDNQVKIRGYRIELGEIETTLAAHPSVKEAAVEARPDRSDGLSLIGYVVAAGDAFPTTNEWRGYLLERLPEYMIPSVFVRLEQLPTNSNGKLDRHALPSPDASRPVLASSYVAPRTALERTIAAIWQDALHLEKVGINDNFFDLGGHSLLIIQVHDRLLEKTGREIAVVDLFRYPTVGTLAQFLGRNEGEAAVSEESRQRADARRGALRERARGGRRH